MSIIDLENDSLLKDENKKFLKKDYKKVHNPAGNARTLSVVELIEDHKPYHEYRGLYGMTHADGWTIVGEAEADYFSWVNVFRAHHPKYGYVLGNFEDVVYFESRKGLNNFLKNHEYEEWDYWDI